MEICIDGSCFLFGMDLSAYYLMAQLKIRSLETGTAPSRLAWLPIVWQQYIRRLENERAGTVL
jgi:hypothetical protein